MIVSFLLALFSAPLGFLYWLKWLLAYIAIRLHNSFHRQRFDLYDVNALGDPVKLGFLVPQLETDLESPFPETHLQEAADEIVFYGVNSKSEYLLVRVSRGCDGTAEAWLQLRTEDGRTFQLADGEGFQRRGEGGECVGFSCGSLQMRHLVPMRKWRIHFCGMLKETSQTQEASKEDVFVKFVFLWKASSDVYDLNLHANVKGFASAIAGSEWRTPLPPIHQLVGALNYYAQSGVIQGSVSVDEATDHEVYLFGEKMRNIGRNSKLAGCKFKNILGKTLGNGFTFHVAKASAPYIFHNLPFGFVVNPDTTMEVLGEVDIAISADLSAQQVSATFTTATTGARYEMQGKPLSDPVVLYSGQGWNGFLEVTFIEFTVNGKKGFGLIMAGEVYTKVSTKPKIIPKVLLPKSIPLTVKFTDPISHFEQVSGGKGASLGKLTKLSEQEKTFSVPEGVVVTTAAYSEFLTPEIEDAVKLLEDVAYGNVAGDVQKICVTVSKLMVKSLLPDSVCNSITQNLKAVFGNQLNHFKFAVRSSATGEDTESMSAAGQMDTFLGIQGIKNIFTAVKQCWASQFGYIAVEYKRRNGQVLNGAMSVVVQRMVGCEVAGVLFTCDPLSGNPSRIALSANYGLGETVVSGSVEPDSIVVQRKADDEVEVISVTVGAKHQRIVMQESGGVVTEDLDENSKNESCISKEMAERLAKLAIKVEKYYRSPRDIEWGILEDKIYLLQSRPVTTGGGVTDHEIQHEFDYPLKFENEYFTVANVGEVMPGTMTPLTMELLFKHFAPIFSREIIKTGGADNVMQSKYFASGLTPFYNRMMVTVIEMMTRYGLGTVRSKGFLVSIFGRLLEDPDLLATAKEMTPNFTEDKTSPLQAFTYYWDMFFHVYGGEKVRKHLEAMNPLHEECETSRDLFHTLIHACSEYDGAFDKHISSTENSSNWNMYLFEILLSAKKGSFDTDVYSDFSRLLATSSNVLSADVPQAIQALADQVAKDMKSEEFKAMTVEEAENWLKTSTSLSGHKFREFMKRHGFRCLMEFEMRSITWEMDPKPLVKILQNLCGVSSSFKKEIDSDEKIFSELNVPLGFVTKALLKLVLPNCRKAVSAREFGKSLSIKSVDCWRKGYTRLGKLMVSEGRIPDADLVFFFTPHEMQDLLQTRSPGSIARAIHRRKLFPVLSKYQFPEIMRGIPKPINADEESSETYEFIADLTMKGIPVSQGVTKGFARVAVSIDEAASLQPGEILIAYSTDIGWSPYFPIISGVVTELGGLISHGAVVSREYGLPCVVGLHGATKKFQTGDYVLLDGKKGILQRLPHPQEQNQTEE